MQPSSTFSCCKPLCSGAYLDADAVTALAAVDATTPVTEVLDILAMAVRRSHEVTLNSIGWATAIDA